MTKRDTPRIYGGPIDGALSPMGFHDEALVWTSPNGTKHLYRFEYSYTNGNRFVYVGVVEDYQMCE